MMSWPGASFGKKIFETAVAYYAAGGDDPETTSSTRALAGLATGALAASGAFTPNTPSVNVPPPPGAAMINPAGSQAAASQRARAAAAGGLNSKISPGATAANGAVGPTSGGKSALGQ